MASSYSETKFMNEDRLRIRYLLNSPLSLGRQIPEAIADYALLYKHTKGSELSREPETVIQSVGQECVAFTASGQPDSSDGFLEQESNTVYYPEDEEFQRILNLATSIGLERQNAHHVKIRGQWLVRKKLARMASRCDYPVAKLWEGIDEMRRFVSGYNPSADEMKEREAAAATEAFFAYSGVTENMQDAIDAFCEPLPVPITVPALSDCVSEEEHRKFLRLGFLPVFMPPIDSTQLKALGLEMDTLYWEEAKIEKSDLPGQWVFIEAAVTPFKFVDPLTRLLGLKARYGFKWGTVVETIMPELAYKLGVNDDAVRIPTVPEWQFAGSLMRYLATRDVMPLHVPDWGQNRSWEWTMTKYGRHHRVLVGKHGLSLMAWRTKEDDWYQIFGFRAIVLAEAAKTRKAPTLENPSDFDLGLAAPSRDASLSPRRRSQGRIAITRCPKMPSTGILMHPCMPTLAGIIAIRGGQTYFRRRTGRPHR